jgi:hypothetical protein
MKILVGSTFGIGNAVLKVPLIKALLGMLPEVTRLDILVGTGHDDYGALNVMQRLQKHVSVDNVYVNEVPNNTVHYDVAIMAIPFDGRWQPDIHYSAELVIDERKRPGNIERLGFDMWTRHEVEYSMDSAIYLGYDARTPSLQFMDRSLISDPNLVYLGLGYKRDPGGFGASKYWGNENYLELIKEVTRLRPGTKFVSTGSHADLIQNGAWLMKRIQDQNVYRFPVVGSLEMSFDMLADCGSYFGQDSGFMHVAASLDMPTFGLTPYPDLRVKNPPLCRRGRMDMFGDGPKVVAQKFVDFVWG